MLLRLGSCNEPCFTVPLLVSFSHIMRGLLVEYTRIHDSELVILLRTYMHMVFWTVMHYYILAHRWQRSMSRRVHGLYIIGASYYYIVAHKPVLVGPRFMPGQGVGCRCCRSVEMHLNQKLKMPLLELI